jgi:hypothetical protein
MGSNKSIGSYSFQKYNATNKSFTIIDNSLTNNTGIDYIINIEEIQFSDFTLSFNIFSNYFELIFSLMSEKEKCFDSLGRLISIVTL